MENVYKLLAKTNFELRHLNFLLCELDYVLASLKVLKSSGQYGGRESQLHLNRNCVFSSCRYGPVGDLSTMLPLFNRRLRVI